LSTPAVKPKPKSKNKKLGSVAYHLLSEKQLRKILKGLKIPSNGDKSLMSKRHAEYINLYNANCDLEHPKSHQKLVEELKRWEKINFENTSPFAKHNLYPKLFSSSKNDNHNNSNLSHSGSSQNSENDNDLAEYEQERKKYLENHKNDFDYLINQIKKRKNKTSNLNDLKEKEKIIDLNAFYDDLSHSPFNNNNNNNNDNNISNDITKSKKIRKNHDSDTEYFESSRSNKRAKIRRGSAMRTPTKKYNTRYSGLHSKNEENNNNELLNNIKQDDHLNISHSNYNYEVYEILSSDEENEVEKEKTNKILNETASTSTVEFKGIEMKNTFGINNFNSNFNNNNNNNNNYNNHKYEYKQ